MLLFFCELFFGSEIREGGLVNSSKCILSTIYLLIYYLSALVTVTVTAINGIDLILLQMEGYHPQYPPLPPANRTFKWPTSTCPRMTYPTVALFGNPRRIPHHPGNWFQHTITRFLPLSHIHPSVSTLN